MHSAAQPQFTKRYQFVTEEKAGGATYTPHLLADFVADQLIGACAHLEGVDSVRVLDPAVGNGELLLSLLEKLLPRTNAPVHVFRFDTHEAALCEARRRISEAVPHVNLHLECKDFLEFVLEQGAVFGTTLLFAPPNAERFDIVIANPPYVRTQIMGADHAQELATTFGLSGRVDLYHAFLIGMAHVLRPGGTAGIIVSNRFMTTKGGAGLRAALRERFLLRHIWDLGDTKIFAAAVLPAVILAEGRNGHDSCPPAFTSIYETTEPATIEALNPVAALGVVGSVALADGRRFRVQHGTLDATGPTSDVWRIATDSGDAWLFTVMAHAWGTFRDIGKIRVGVKTCADKVFIRSDWNALPDHERPELFASCYNASHCGTIPVRSPPRTPVHPLSS